MKSLSRARLFATPWTIAYQAPPSMGFPRQGYCSGLPLPSPKEGVKWCVTEFTTGFFGSVQFSCSVVSDFLLPHGPQHARPPCPSSTAGVYPNSCPLCRWCHPTISSSVVPFSSCLQSFPASGSFQMSQLFNQVAKVLEFQLQYQSFQWTLRIEFSFRMDWLDLLLQHHSSKASILWCLAFFIIQLSHPYMTTGKTIALTRWTFVGNVMSPLFNMLPMDF